MAEINKNTQEAARGTGGQSTATQRAPVQSTEHGVGKPDTRPSTSYSSSSSEADRSRDYEARNRQGNSGRAGERDEIGAIVDQAKHTVSEAYEQASRSVNETLGHAKEYSRENPGTATLVAFGVGVGVGVLLTSGVLTSGRSRSQRIVPPVMTALSEIAAELFRR